MVIENGEQVKVALYTDGWVRDCNLCPSSDEAGGRPLWELKFNSCTGQNLMTLYLCGEHLALLDRKIPIAAVIGKEVAS